jgi:hypothetical protein
VCVCVHTIGPMSKFLLCMQEGSAMNKLAIVYAKKP